MRIAWIGPTPTQDSGVTYLGSVYVRALAQAGHEIDLFVVAPEGRDPEFLRGTPGLSLVVSRTRWDWGRWYSRTPLTSFASGQGARAAGYARLISAIERRHALRPYDVLLQFSQTELFTARRRHR